MVAQRGLASSKAGLMNVVKSGRDIKLPLLYWGQKGLSYTKRPYHPQESLSLHCLQVCGCCAEGTLSRPVTAPTNVQHWLLVHAPLMQ